MREIATDTGGIGGGAHTYEGDRYKLSRRGSVANERDGCRGAYINEGDCLQMERTPMRQAAAGSIVEAAKN
jgi:hypothetical protein